MEILVSQSGKRRQSADGVIWGMERPTKVENLSKGMGISVVPRRR